MNIRLFDRMRPRLRRWSSSSRRPDHQPASSESASDSLESVRHELYWETSVSRALSKLYEPLISPEATIEQMARLVLEQALSITSSRVGFVAAIGYSGDRHIFHTVSEMQAAMPAHAAVPRRLTLPQNEQGEFAGLRGHALNSGKAFFTNSPRKHSTFAGYPDWHMPIERFLSAPVILDGRPAGQISLANSPADYCGRDLRAVQRLAGFYALALQRKHGQDGMQAALEEKEVLLREIHHRVKNNLQVISSLLNLQAGSLDDPAIAELLKESQNRVRSMAMVHEQLHRSSHLSRIDFSEYVRNLTSSLFCSYGVSSAEVSLKLDVTNAHLPIDIAVPCGLLIQELVSNALKHAFPDGRNGEIELALKPVGDSSAGKYRLSVSDDGVGLPEGFGRTTSRSLGLRLVSILAEQLNASAGYGDGPGTSYQLEFRASNQGQD